jgi:hypothetical protein
MQSFNEAGLLTCNYYGENNVTPGNGSRCYRLRER